MQKIFVGTAIGLLLAAAGSPLRAETLADAVTQAIGAHPAVQAAQQAFNASGQTVREQRSAYFPELSVNMTGGRLYGDNATSRGLSVTRGAGYSYLGEGSASVTQKVFDWGETGSRVDAALAREQAAHSTVAGAQESIALRAAQAYIALLRAGDLKRAAADNLATSEEYQKRIGVQVEEGGADDAELNRANDLLLLARNAVTEFDGQYAQAQADYIEAVGHAPQSSLSRPAPAGGLPGGIDAAVQAAFDAHPQIAAAKQAVLAGGYDAEAEGSGYLPKISAQMSYLKRDQEDIIGGESVDARAVMKMDWAYSTGGAQAARESRAAFLKQQSQAQLDELYRRIERDVRVAWSALEIAQRQRETQSGRKDATARVVETYKTQYDGGNRSLIELMQAESQAFDARVAYDNADFGVLNAGYTLSAAMGYLSGNIPQGGSVAQVAPPVSQEAVLQQVVSQPVPAAVQESGPVVMREPVAAGRLSHPDVRAETQDEIPVSASASVRTSEVHSTQASATAFMPMREIVHDGTGDDDAASLNREDSAVAQLLAQPSSSFALDGGMTDAGYDGKDQDR